MALETSIDGNHCPADPASIYVAGGCPQADG